MTVVISLTLLKHQGMVLFARAIDSLCWFLK